MNTKTIGYVFLGLLVLVGAFFLLNNYIYQEKQEGAETEPYEARLEGEYVCLPHKDTEGPQTDECAAGLKTVTDEYYALDLAQAEDLGSLTLGDRVSATGLVTPIERLSTDHWEQYMIDGIFSVTGLVVIN
jgi:hypothetical protein